MKHGSVAVDFNKTIDSYRHEMAHDLFDFWVWEVPKFRWPGGENVARIRHEKSQWVTSVDTTIDYCNCNHDIRTINYRLNHLHIIIHHNYYHNQ